MQLFQGYQTADANIISGHNIFMHIVSEATVNFLFLPAEQILKNQAAFADRE
jgi:hypothetical protein